MHPGHPDPVLPQVSREAGLPGAFSGPAVPLLHSPTPGSPGLPSRTARGGPWMTNGLTCAQPAVSGSRLPGRLGLGRVQPCISGQPRPLQLPRGWGACVGLCAPLRACVFSVRPETGRAGCTGPGPASWHRRFPRVLSGEPPVLRSPRPSLEDRLLETAEPFLPWGQMVLSRSARRALFLRRCAVPRSLLSGASFSCKIRERKARGRAHGPEGPALLDALFPEGGGGQPGAGVSRWRSCREEGGGLLISPDCPGGPELWVALFREGARSQGPRLPWGDKMALGQGRKALHGPDLPQALTAGVGGLTPGVGGQGEGLSSRSASPDGPAATALEAVSLDRAPAESVSCEADL